MDAVNRSPRTNFYRTLFIVVVVSVTTLNRSHAMNSPATEVSDTADSLTSNSQPSARRFPIRVRLLRTNGTVTKSVATVSHQNSATSSRRPVLVAHGTASPATTDGRDRPEGNDDVGLTSSQPDDVSRIDVLPARTESIELEVPRIGKERRDHVRRIIKKVRPEADEDAIDIWVEEFASLPDGNIEFLVSQSSLLKGGIELPAILGDSVDGSNNSSEPEASQSPTELMIQPATLSGSAKSDEVITRNLKNVMTIGYREELELKAASVSTTSGLTRLPVFHHGTGPSVVTGSPFHLAIQTAGSVFFQLEDGRLTRNGMFSRLSDGRIGITDGSSEVALKDAPVVKSPAGIQIRPDGIVLEAERRIGRIAIVAVLQPELLNSQDGVYFEAKGEVGAATEVELRVGALELSNVDVPRNRYLQFAQRP